MAHGVDCRSEDTPTTDEARAAANTVDNGVNGTIQTPWLTANFKDGVGHSLRTGEFFEGGLNLTESDLGGRCFNTFLGDTRSSQSLTATLFDYAGGQLGECVTTLVTTVGWTGGSVSIGTGSVAVSDSANLSVNGADTWSGTLSFFICGPIAAPATCDTGGLQIASAINNQGHHDARRVGQRYADIGGPVLLAWLLRQRDDGVDDATDSSTGECFDR